MLKEFKFKYGDKYINFQLPEDSLLNELYPKETKSITDIREELFSLMDNPMGSKPFNELFFNGDKVVIIVSDITRLWIQTKSFLPYIVERLNTIGVKDDDIIILVATGTHRGQSSKELIQIVGDEIYDRIEIAVHDCDKDLIYVGTTSYGTKVEVNKLVTERKVILTGGIVHHLMAGYGGGRKSILPGIAGRKTIVQNHLHALHPSKKQSSPLIGAGVTLSNPINLDMIEAANFVKPDFLINSIVDPKGNIIKFAVGGWLRAWQEGCRLCDEMFGIPVKEKADLVIASCGGFPKDISLYQGVKALFNASLAVKPGGTILLLAECRDGGGADEYFRWIEPLKNEVLDESLRSDFTIPGYIFYATVELSQKCNVILLSTIDPQSIEPMGIKAVNSIEEAFTLTDVSKKGQKITLMPYGGTTVPLYRSNI